MGRKDLLGINTKGYDRGLIYRLDYETSGVLLLAKSDSVYEKIRTNFSTIVKKKLYRLKCGGKLTQKQGRWFDYLSAYGPKGKKIRAIQNGRENELAKLSFELISYCEVSDISDVQVELLTGMRHQIRVQFATRGHPLVGDILYGGKNETRLFLHALKYELNFSNTDMSFFSPLPVDW